LGLGIGGIRRLTAEADEVLRSADTILHLSAVGADLVDRYPGEVVSLLPVYQGTPGDESAYQAIADALIAAAEKARDRGGYACFATYGHPLWLVDSSRMAMRLAAESSLRVGVVPGISSFDTLLIDSPVPLDRGAQLVETSEFVHAGLVVNTVLPLVLFQFGDYARERLNPAPVHERRFARLVARLQSIYPGERQAFLVVSSWADGIERQIRATTVGQLADLCQSARPGSSLVVAGSREALP
jgi:tetrapyrrole (corrin/porphyrin) methylase-like protein